MTEYFNEENIKDIKFIHDDKCIKLFFNKNNIKIKCSNVILPFGVEKNYDNYIIKIIKNNESHDLFTLIENIEENNIKYLLSQNIDKNTFNYKSQIDYKPNYGTFLTLKIPIIKSQIITSIYNKDGDNINLFDLIKKKSNVSVEFELDSIWLFKDKYSSVPKVKNIYLL
jgi:hypothetical protein